MATLASDADTVASKPRKRMSRIYLWQHAQGLNVTVSPEAMNRLGFMLLLSDIMKFCVECRMLKIIHCSAKIERSEGNKALQKLEPSDVSKLRLQGTPRPKVEVSGS
jgi:hypothetical protein